MKQTQFDLMDLNDKACMVCQDGEYIGLRIAQDSLIDLYVLLDFFVEVSYYQGRFIYSVESISEESIVTLYDIDLKSLLIVEK